MKRWLKFILPWFCAGLIMPLLWTVLWPLLGSQSYFLIYLQYLTSPISMLQLGDVGNSIVKITALLMISNAVIYIVIGTLFLEIKIFIINFIKKEEKNN